MSHQARIEAKFELDNLPDNQVWPVGGLHHAEARDRKIFQGRKRRQRYPFHLATEVAEADLSGRQPERRERQQRLSNRALLLIWQQGLVEAKLVDEIFVKIHDRDPENLGDWGDLGKNGRSYGSDLIAIKDIPRGLLLSPSEKLAQPGQKFLGSLFENSALPLLYIADQVLPADSSRQLQDFEVHFASYHHIEDTHRPEPKLVPTWHPFEVNAYAATGYTNQTMREFLMGQSRFPVEIPIAKVVDPLRDWGVQVDFVTSRKDQMGPIIKTDGDKPIRRRVEDKGIHLPQGSLRFTYSVGSEVNVHTVIEAILQGRESQAIEPFKPYTRTERRLRSEARERAERVRFANAVLRDVFPQTFASA